MKTEEALKSGRREKRSGVPRGPLPPIEWRNTELLAALFDRTGLAGEQFRKLGLKIQALNDTLGGQMKLVLVTSPLMGDGKTATAVNLAITLCQEEGRRVALVDCDTRNPRVQSLMSVPPRRGLYELLTTDRELEEAREIIEGVPLDVYALPPGMGRRLDPLPIEKLKSVFGRLKQAYDYVVCDAPPVLPIADTAALVRLADGVAMVVRAAQTPRQAVSKTLAAIDRSKLIGFVLNAVNEKTVASYYYPYHEEAVNGESDDPS